MPESPGVPDSGGTWLGFDFGLGRIGVAVGQSMTNTATPLATIRNGQAPDWPAVEARVREWQPRGFIVGLPLNTLGEETEISRSARRFGRELEERFGRPVHYCDERLTSKAADAQFAEMRAAGRARRKDAANMDAMAAAIILQNWLQSRADQAPSSEHGGPPAGH